MMDKEYGGIDHLGCLPLPAWTTNMHIQYVHVADVYVCIMYKPAKKLGGISVINTSWNSRDAEPHCVPIEDWVMITFY